MTERSEGIGMTVLFGCFFLTAFPFSANLTALKDYRSNAPSGAFFVPCSGARPQKPTRWVNRREYNTRKGNNATAVIRGVEARHQQQTESNTMKNRKSGSLAPALTPAQAAQEIDWKCIFRMEEAIYRVWTISDMVVDRLTKELDDTENKFSGKVAAGLQLLETEALNSLEDAFDQVTAYCRQLRNQKRK